LCEDSDGAVTKAHFPEANISIYMVRGERVLTLPNPHRKEIGVDLLRRILKQASITLKQWEQDR
jgi:hypothetical protein